MKAPLTKAQQLCLAHLREYLRENGEPPTQTELADLMGKTQQTVRGYLISMERRGWITLFPGITRGIALRGESA